MEPKQSDTFTERMLKRASSRTLLRRARIIEAIENTTFVIPSATVNRYNKDTANVTLPSPIANVEEIGVPRSVKNTDDEQKHKKIYPVLPDTEHNGKINSETRIIDTEEIIETPRATRRSYRPNMESTRTSLTPVTGNTENKSSSVQPESSISTIPPTGESNTSSKIPYEVERFLEDALGDELNNTSVTYGIDPDGRDRTNSHFNASELISEDRTPFYRRISEFLSHKKKHNVSGNESFIKNLFNDTSTLNRSMRLYRSLSHRIKSKIRGALVKEKSADLTTAEPIRQTVFDDRRMELMEAILRQMRIQQSVIQQASKALNVCHTSKEFIGSSEEVESERLLLLAEIRRSLLQEELKKLSNVAEDVPPPAESPSVTECAEVKIEHVSLPLREVLKREPAVGETVEWFVIVVIEGMNVWGSPPVPCPVESPAVEFSGFVCTIDNLKPDLRIALEVYGLKQKSAVVYNHEDKYHIVRMNKTVSCPSPTKLLKKVDRAAPARTHQTQGICSSSFVACGRLELGLHDLTLLSPWPLTATAVDSILLGTIDLTLSCKLHLSIAHQGFVNYGDEAGGFIMWNRRWCVLKGHTMMFWNYPRDQETKLPVTTIDLIQCVSEKIGEVNRALCAKPRTIVLETVKMRDVGDTDSILVECRQSCTIHRHLLSYDTKRDLNEWTSKLNHVICALREWNVTFMKESPPSPMVSDL